jgi:hypothetical protein
MADSRQALVELRSVTTVISGKCPAQDRVDSGLSTIVVQVDLSEGETRDLGLRPEGPGQGVTRKKVNTETNLTSLSL